MGLFTLLDCRIQTKAGSVFVLGSIYSILRNPLRERPHHKRSQGGEGFTKRSQRIMIKRGRGMTCKLNVLVKLIIPWNSYQLVVVQEKVSSKTTFDLIRIGLTKRYVIWKVV